MKINYIAEIPDDFDCAKCQLEKIGIFNVALGCKLFKNKANCREYCEAHKISEGK